MEYFIINNRKKGKAMIKSIKMVCVDWLSREKIIELNQDQNKSIEPGKYCKRKSATF